MTYTYNGIVFTLWRWQFIEDGYAGAIYFIVPKGTYREASSDGASACPMDEASDMAKFMGCNEPDGQMIRVATPCLEHGEEFEEKPFWFLIREAAEWADACLPRASTNVNLSDVQFVSAKGDA